MRNFSVYGLEVSSGLPLDGLGLSEGNSGVPDVAITEGSVPTRLKNPEIQRPYCQALPGELLISIPNIGRFLVSDGSSIRIERAPGVSVRDVAPYVLGSCFGALLLQKRKVALHGAGVCSEGGAFVICGLSGAGKSTITAHLCGNGRTVLCDDLAVVETTSPFHLQPGFAETRLTENAATSLGYEFDRATARRAPTGKVVFSTAEHFTSQSVPLAGIIAIEQANTDKLTLDRLRPQTAMTAFRRHTYRKNYVTRDVAKALFGKWAKLAAAIPVWQIIRPNGLDTTSEVVALSEQILHEAHLSNQELCA